MKTIGDLISQNEKILDEAGIFDARFDISAILSDYLNCSLSELRMRFSEVASENLENKLVDATNRLILGEPVAYIIGKAYFYYEEYKVGKGVLIPRPDTEILVEKSIEVIKDSGITNPVIWDLCTGTGCVGISLTNALLKEGIKAKTYLVDLFDEALAYTKANLNQAKDISSIEIVKLDVLTELDKMPQRPDFIVSNPPYINSVDMEELQKSVKDFEPSTALFGLRDDGLAFYEVFAKKARELLSNKGAILVEHGYDQEQGVLDIFKAEGLVNCTCIKDFGGNPRVTFAYGGENNG